MMDGWCGTVAAEFTSFDILCSEEQFTVLYYSSLIFFCSSSPPPPPLHCMMFVT